MLKKYLLFKSGQRFYIDMLKWGGQVWKCNKGEKATVLFNLKGNI